MALTPFTSHIIDDVVVVVGFKVAVSILILLLAGLRGQAAVIVIVRLCLLWWRRHCPVLIITYGVAALRRTRIVLGGCGVQGLLLVLQGGLEFIVLVLLVMKHFAWSDHLLLSSRWWGRVESTVILAKIAVGPFLRCVRGPGDQSGHLSVVGNPSALHAVER